MPRTAVRQSGVPAAKWYLGMATLLLLRSCAGVTPIKTLMDDPARFDDKTVRVVGEVGESVGALGVGAYQLNDSTGTISVVSEGGGAPRSGARVGVEGTFKAVYTLGPRSGAVIVEKHRYTP